MGLQPQLIAPFQTGLETDVEPWLCPVDSFRVADNVHVHHGFVEKRSGFNFFGYMVVNPVATITNITATNPVVVTAANTFSNGDMVLITNVTGMTEVNNQIYTVANRTALDFELSGVNGISFTAYIAGGRAATFTGNRIMGIYRYLKFDGTQLSLIFDTKRAAFYDTTTNTYSPLDASDIMDSSVYDYVWGVNWTTTGISNRFYFTNGKIFNGTLNGIRYFDDTSPTITTSLTPSLGGTRTLYGGKLLFVLNGRLIVLYVYEVDTGPMPGTFTYPQRARWSAVKDDSNWDDITPGGGSFVDAPTGDQIISARALQNQIIVYFTNSVWRLVPLQDPNRSFRWEKINSFRACNGKMATVSYDRYINALGVRGITATDGVEVRRIDDRIENFVNNEVHANEFQKVFCERSYENQRWWTLYPSLESEENNKALIFDDTSGAFTTYTIALNCLGYGNLSRDLRLSDFTASNMLDFNLQEVGEDTLQDYFFQDQSEIFLGGDIAGTIFELEAGTSDFNADIDIEIFTNAWAPFKEEGRESLLSYIDIYYDSDVSTTGFVEFYRNDEDTFYASQSFNLLPNLNYVCDVNFISQSNPGVVNAPGHGLITGDNIFIYNVEGMLEVNNNIYSITVIDDNSFNINTDTTSFEPYLVGGAVYKKEFYKKRVWKRAYAGQSGYQHRIKLVFLGKDRPLRIHGFKPYFSPRGRRTID